MQEREYGVPQGPRKPTVGSAVGALLMGTGVLRDLDEDRSDLPQRSERTKTIARAMMMTEIDGLPKGLPKEALIFACATADLGLWDALAEHNPRMADALLLYYTTDAYTSEIARTIPGIATEANAYKLLSRARDFLWERLPDKPTAAFPYDKALLFPRDRLRKTPPGAGSEGVRRRWTEDAEWRTKGEERLRRMRHAKAERRGLVTDQDTER